MQSKKTGFSVQKNRKRYKHAVFGGGVESTVAIFTGLGSSSVGTHVFGGVGSAIL